MSTISELDSTAVGEEVRQALKTIKREVQAAERTTGGDGGRSG